MYISQRKKRHNYKNLVFAFLIISVIAITGTFAYLTGKDEVVNTFTTGDVSIELSEPEWDAANPSGKVENAIAKQVIPKDPTITNTGTNNAYVYVMLEVPKAYKTTVILDKKPTEVNHYQLFDYETNPDWVLIDSETANDKESYNYYLYGYKQPTTPGESVKLLDEIQFANITSEFKNYFTERDITELSVNVTGYAIQSDFYGNEASDAATAWELYVNQNSWEWPTNPYPGSVDEIKQNNNITYYKSLRNAISDINTDSIGDLAVDEANSALGVYIDEDDVPNIILFEDITEGSRSTITTSMIINLGGKKLTFREVSYGLLASSAGSGVITIDGRIPGGEIISESTGTNAAACMQIQPQYTLNALSVNFTAKAERNLAYGIVSSGTLNLRDCNLNMETQSGAVMAIGTTGGISSLDSCAIMTKSESGSINSLIISGQCYMNGCSVEATSGGSISGGIRLGQNNKYGYAEIKNSSFYSYASESSGNAFCVSVASNSNGSDLKITDCNIQCISEGLSQGLTCSDTDSTVIVENSSILADSQYTVNGSSFYTDGIYVAYGTEAYITNCHIQGVRSAISSAGTVYVDGGIYEGYGYGGLHQYGQNSLSKIKNATLSTWNYDGLFDTNTMTGDKRNTAVYIEGNENNTYLHNIKFDGKEIDIIFTDDSDESTGNSLFVSNPQMYKGININSNVSTFYIGQGCDFNENLISILGNATVKHTTDTYNFDMPLQ